MSSSSIICGNATPVVSSCMYSTSGWTQKSYDDFYSTSQISAPECDNSVKDDDGADDNNGKMKKSRGHKHVPHKDKPAQVVAKRNARERRRVQAVNNAFVKLQKAVPFENTRGKRISKVKTLQNAIDYIQNLQKLLQDDINYQQIHVISNFYSHKINDDDYFANFSYRQEEF